MEWLGNKKEKMTKKEIFKRVLLDSKEQIEKALNKKDKPFLNIIFIDSIESMRRNEEILERQCYSVSFDDFLTFLKRELSRDFKEKINMLKK